MSHQDRTSDIIVNHETLKQVVDLLLPSVLYAGMKAHGNATWKPRMLAVAALLWATSGLTNLTDRFEQAGKIVKKVFRWQATPGQTYQGFIKILRKYHADLLSAVTPHIQVQMKEMLPGQWMIAGYVVYAVDGSRIDLPRTESLENAYCAGGKNNPNNKKRKKRGHGGVPNQSCGS